MINFTLEDSHAGIFINAWEKTGIKVNNQLFEESLMLTPETLAPWAPQAFAELDSEVMEQLLQTEATLIILGTGNRHCFPPAKLLAPFYRQGIGVEVMSSAAACRTFNVLVSENRRVAAGIIVEP